VDSLEDLTAGWEIVEKKRKNSKKPDEKDAESEETGTPVADEKAKPAKRKNEDRNRNRNFNDDRKKGREGRDDKRPRNPQGSKKEQEKARDAKVVEPQVDKEVKVNGYSFKKSEHAKETEPAAGGWRELSELITDNSTLSDDTAPLRTAFFQLRYYHALPRKEREQRPPAVWTEMAKYNYASRQGEGKEGEEDFPAESNEETPYGVEEELVDAFLRSLGPHFTAHLTKPHYEKNKSRRFLVEKDVESTKQDAVKHLVKGVSLEIPVFSNNLEQANDFVDRTFALFDASSVRCFVLPGRLWKRGFVETGFFVFDNRKIALLWLLGYD